MTLLMDVRNTIHTYEDSAEAELIMNTCAGDAVGIIVASSMLTEDANVLALVNIAPELPKNFMVTYDSALSRIFDETAGIRNNLEMCKRLMERMRAKCGKEPFDE